MLTIDKTTVPGSEWIEMPMTSGRDKIRLWVRRIKRATVASVGVLGVAYGGYQVWMHTRSQPEPTERELFQGVTYRREVYTKPRPMVAHIVTIDLRAPGIGFLVTPGDQTQLKPVRARTTSAFLTEFKTQIVINGDFFYPWHSNTMLSYYPHVGDRVDVEGFAASRGIAYCTDPHKLALFPTLYLSKDNRVQMNSPDGSLYNALSGNRMLLSQGKFVPSSPSQDAHLDPRTAIGYNREATKLIIVLIDGRQPNYSEGATPRKLADLLSKHGAYTAMNLDGGGSTTLAVEEKDGNPALLNSTIDCRIPFRERPVANHLGIFARPLQQQ